MGRRRRKRWGVGGEGSGPFFHSTPRHAKPKRKEKVTGHLPRCPLSLLALAPHPSSNRREIGRCTRWAAGNFGKKSKSRREVHPAPAHSRRLPSRRLAAGAGEEGRACSPGPAAGLRGALSSGLSSSSGDRALPGWGCCRHCSCWREGGAHAFSRGIRARGRAALPEAGTRRRCR